MASTAKIDTLKTKIDDGSTQLIYPITSSKAVVDDDGTTVESRLVAVEKKAETNQNAFSNVIVGDTTIAADNETDSLTLIAGENIVLTPNAENDTITIEASGGSDFNVTQKTQEEYEALSEEEQDNGAYIIISDVTVGDVDSGTKISSESVSQIELVTELPETGEEGTVYFTYEVTT